MLKTIASEQMYQFYKANKDNLPSNIRNQRDFIIDCLCQDQEISAVFADATQNAEAELQTWGKNKKRKKQP